MLDLRLIRNDPELVRVGIRRRGGDDAALDALLRADERRRGLLTEVEGLKAERNRVSEEIAKIKQAKGDASAMIAEMRAVGERIKALDEQVRETDAEMERLALLLPNIPDATTPEGTTEAENVVVREWGEPRAFDFEPKPHWEIGVALDIVDFERAAKIVGREIRGVQGRGGAAEASADQLHAGYAHEGARLHGNRAAGAGKAGGADRVGASAEVRG